MTTATAASRVDPRQRFPQPPFPKQEQDVPGEQSEMQPRADHGEESYRGSDKLTDCVALITGGDSGIGRAVAIAYAREGADVVISYLEEDRDANDTVHWIEQAGRPAIAIPGDISNEDHARHLVEHTIDKFGRLDVLVNNAAYQMPHESVDEWSSEQFEYTFRTNLFAMFYLSKAALRYMAPGSVIINTASIQAFRPRGILLDYAASKSAIVGFTKALAQLAIESGVRVNAVAPGPVWTPLIPSTFDAEHVENFGGDTPLGRPAQPAELAPIFVLLASAEASYITGEVYGATGGTMPL